MDGIAWAGSAMVAARVRLDVATDNLANVSTDGFRKIAARGTLTPFGVRVRRYASAEHGPLRATGRAWDLAIVGDGAFWVRDAAGRTSRTRAGSFVRERDGSLRDSQDRALVVNGRIVRVPEGTTVDERGALLPAGGGTPIARIALPAGSSIRSGFLESAAVNAVGEMIDVLRAQRSFETAQKVVTAIDGVREKSSGEIARVK